MIVWVRALTADALANLNSLIISTGPVLVFATAPRPSGQNRPGRSLGIAGIGLADSRRSPGEQMASMRNGSGDAYSIVFSPAGAFIRGFDHESAMSPRHSGRPPIWPVRVWPYSRAASAPNLAARSSGG